MKLQEVLVLLIFSVCARFSLSFMAGNKVGFSRKFQHALKTPTLKTAGGSRLSGVIPRLEPGLKITPQLEHFLTSSNIQSEIVFQSFSYDQLRSLPLMQQVSSYRTKKSSSLSFGLFFLSFQKSLLMHLSQFSTFFKKCVSFVNILSEIVNPAEVVVTGGAGSLISKALSAGKNLISSFLPSFGSKSLTESTKDSLSVKEIKNILTSGVMATDEQLGK
jgi:hypothetical protein